MSKHRTASHRCREPHRARLVAEDSAGHAGLAVLLTALAITLPLVAMARDGEPANKSERAPVSSVAAPPSASPTSGTELPDGEVAAAAGPVPRPSEPPASPVAIPERGSGRFEVAAAPAAPLEDATTYRVEVEKELPYTTKQVARFVETTLSDDRGWAAEHRLARVDGHADLRIVLATPETADELCAPLDTDGRLSCRNGDDVVLNAWRWHFGADSYASKLTAYRRYVVNHETGHALGYPHVGCPGNGVPAPVMLQQTKGLDGCTANPWPARVDLAGH
ncbi:DUF3152 domain-containing protein [Nocardioides panzhihuensis]|uniref:DUF3152 domain-containing protein n=1 Tax=Nocardioides panzhihuensis TaxID=860243 RepID=A0A7Z0IRT6_9ACTN|nr:DUF3152 domain-containing protein [Nocardioides panzhihuensis]NYI77047.1 hypothetical protein [Nocardioides panzhihuensis]